ncbi:MAG: hypothetical protein JSV61_13370 [Anaerolineales bacterium]|nr:MAG: hypothetical protein JSV61_13370 [Anaerolineales bacterium]
MDPGKAGLVICLTLFIVIGINAAIYASIRRGNTVGQIELLRKAAKRARNPWEDEDEALKELSKRVSELRKDGYDEAHDRDFSNDE